MAISATSRKYSDNFRAMRRFLQGRGVNLRMTIVDAEPADPYIDERVVVPGLHSDDKVIAVLNLTDLNDATGYLDDGAVAASHEFGSLDSRFTVTALKKGLGGNMIALKAVTGSGISSPLTVQIGDRDTLFGETGHAGWTGILVTLATNGAGTLDTTDNDASAPNSAQSVRVAILNAQDHPMQESIVDVTIDNGDGTDHVGNISATALSGGTAFDQGPAVASLATSAADPYGNILYTAKAAGADGNSITVAHTAGGSLDVSVAGTDITVTYVVGTTTEQDVIDAVNADADASALVYASPIRYGASGANEEADNLVAAMSATPLAGGVDPGVQFTVSPLGKKLLIAWLTKETRDEN